MLREKWRGDEGPGRRREGETAHRGRRNGAADGRQRWVSKGCGRGRQCRGFANCIESLDDTTREQFLSASTSRVALHLGLLVGMSRADACMCLYGRWLFQHSCLTGARVQRSSILSCVPHSDHLLLGGFPAVKHSDQSALPFADDFPKLQARPP
jgi:hypothetical protein